jgi:hypothetical protein
VALSHIYWSRYFKREFIPQVQHLVSALEFRLLPNFLATDIAHEADSVADEMWERFMTSPATGDEGPSEFAEAAQDAGITHYMMLTGIRQGLINMFASGLYHTFEQQLMLFHRKQILPPTLENDKSHFKVAKIKGALRLHGINVEVFPCWHKIDEMRLVANAVKHAEGDSSEELRARRPDLFRDPLLQKFDLPLWDNAPSNRVFLPMVGEDIYIPLEEIQQYRDAIVDFWGCLAEAMTNT